jgi:hypothetical protein
MIVGMGFTLVVLASATLVAAPSETPAAMLAAHSPRAQAANPTISLGPTATPHASPTDDPGFWPSMPPETTPSPTPTPTPAATFEPGAKRATIVLRINCTSQEIRGQEAWSWGVSGVHGDRIYLACGADWDVRLAAVNASTGNIARWYKLSEQDFAGQPFIYDGGFWYSNSSIGAMCVGRCPITDPWLARADPNTGTQTFRIDGWHLFGDGLDYVWAAPAVSAYAATLLKIDPVTMATSTIPWTYGDPHVACGSLWGFAWSESKGTTTITRVDPASGAPLASYVEKGHLYEPHAVSGGCWAEAQLTAAQAGRKQPGSIMNSDDMLSRFVKLGSAGVDARTSLYWEEVFFAGESMWLERRGGDPDYVTYVQRIDPETLKAIGTLWMLSEWPDSLMGIGGVIWTSDYTGIARTNIPTGEPVPEPTPTATPTAEPSG